MSVKRLSPSGTANGEFSLVATGQTGDTFVPCSGHTKLFVSTSACTTTTLTVKQALNGTPRIDIKSDVYQTAYPRAAFAGGEVLAFFIAPGQPVTISTSASAASMPMRVMSSY